MDSFGRAQQYKFKGTELRHTLSGHFNDSKRPFIA
jgi:hypothetical protein